MELIILPYYPRRSTVIFFFISTLFQAALADDCKKYCDLDCGSLRKCEVHSAEGSIDMFGYSLGASVPTHCECKTDTGKVAGIAVGIILFFIATIVAICWCCKCCCFNKPAQVVVVQTPKATVAQA